MANTSLTRTFGTPTNNLKWTFSAWIKRSKIASAGTIFSARIDGTNFGMINISGSDVLELGSYIGGWEMKYFTNRLFRDTSAWYHIFVSNDSSLASPETKLYINGVLETSFSVSDPASQNEESMINKSGVAHMVGQNGNNQSYFDGSMSHIHFTDGYVYDATAFGETDATTGEWKIKTSPSVTYGTNGFFILKDGNSVTDQSGNSNDFTVGGGTLTKTEDCPSNVFATLNPLFYAASTYTLLNGNLTTNGTSSNADRSLYGTIGASSGKYYFETKINGTNSGDSNNIRVGIVSDDQVVQTANNGTFFSTSRGYAYYGQDGSKRNNGSSASYGDTFTTGNIIGCAFDLDNNKIYWSKNGVWQNSGDPTSGATGTGSAYNLATGYSYLPAISNYYTEDKVSINFGNGYFGTTAVASAGTNASGNGIFEYDVPTGYTALSTKGLNL
jgi:hypothetical protein